MAKPDNFCWATERCQKFMCLLEKILNFGKGLNTDRAWIVNVFGGTALRLRTGRF
jgi:hypothetical protein